MAGLKRRDDGLYQKQITAGRKADGNYIRKTVYAKTQKDLESKAEEARKEWEFGGISLSPKTTFAEITDIWMDSFGGIQTERWRYQQWRIIKKHLYPTLANMQVKDLKQIHLQQLINAKAKEGYATGTMKQMKQTAKRILDIAVEADMIRRNVFEKVKVPKVEPTERQALTSEQIQMVNETWETHFMGYPAMIMMYCGLRRGELLALRWRDVDLENDVIHVTKAVELVINQPTVKKPKSKAGIRDVPIPEILHNVLIQVKGDNDELVCPGSQGQIMSESAYDSAWHSYMNHLNLFYGGRNGSRTQKKRMVIQPFTAHMLRHTYATMLYDAGVDVKSAQHFLGHADLKLTLSVYTHLTKYKEDGAIDALNKMIDEKSLKKQAGQVEETTSPANSSAKLRIL